MKKQKKEQKKKYKAMNPFTLIWIIALIGSLVQLIINTVLEIKSFVGMIWLGVAFIALGFSTVTRKSECRESVELLKFEDMFYCYLLCFIGVISLIWGLTEEKFMRELTFGLFVLITTIVVHMSFAIKKSDWAIKGYFAIIENKMHRKHLHQMTQMMKKRRKLLRIKSRRDKNGKKKTK